MKRKADQYLQSDEIKALLFKHRRLCRFLEKHSGDRVRNVDDFINLNDVLNVERENGFVCVIFLIYLIPSFTWHAFKNNNILEWFYFSLPKWVESVLKKSHDTIELFTAIKYESFTHTTPLKKIKGGFAVKQIFDQLKNKTLGISKPNRVYLYFTHGHSVVNILNTLNVYKVNAKAIYLKY